MRSKEPMTRFLEKVDFTKDRKCWIWTGSMDGLKPFYDNKDSTKGNYGRFALDGYHMIPAHRASFILFGGRVLPKMDVAHKCDRPACVNPMHLKQMTRQENMDDQVLKRRTWPHRPGATSPRRGTGFGHVIKGRQGVFVDATCSECGGASIQNAAAFKLGKKSLCSKKCKSSFISKLQSKEKIIVPCHTCGTQVARNESEVKARKHIFCTAKCYWKSLEK